MTTQFIIFPNGKNSNQLKNEADIKLKAIKKKSKKKDSIPKKSDILNDLSKAITGLPFNKAVSNLKPLSPFLEDEKNFFIPFENNSITSYVNLFSSKVKFAHNDFEKQYINFMYDTKDINGIGMELYDVIFKPEYKNIIKIDGGWKLKLTFLKDNPHDEEYWLELIKTDDGLVISYYVAEYNGNDGYDVNCINDEFSSWEQLIEETDSNSYDDDDDIFDENDREELMDSFDKAMDNIKINNSINKKGIALNRVAENCKFDIQSLYDERGGHWIVELDNGMVDFSNGKPMDYSKYKSVFYFEDVMKAQGKKLV
jgi:hypothetical protein